MKITEIRIKDIVDNLRDYAREDTVSIRTSININEIVLYAISLLDSQIKKMTTNLNVDLAEYLPPVKASAQQIEQVIINLILNSLQALRDKKKEVLISTAFDKNSRAVIVSIRDEGIGIPSDFVSHIREPFYTTKSGSGGMGLGLFISHSIIEKHRGSLEFESRMDEGTTAVIKLPAEQFISNGIQK
jgi:signal transduction histidine kinase